MHGIFYQPISKEEHEESLKKHTDHVVEQYAKIASGLPGVTYNDLTNK